MRICNERRIVFPCSGHTPSRRSLGRISGRGSRATVDLEVSFMRQRSVALIRTGAVSVLLAAALAHAAAPRIYSIQGVDCGDCGPRIAATVKKIPGVKKASFDKYTVELTVTAADKVTDAQVLD